MTILRVKVEEKFQDGWMTKNAPKSPEIPIETPGKPESIVARLRRREAELTGQERRAAAYLRLHYPAAGLGPMARFARAANVSPQTVLRLLAKLEFGSWEDFQDRLRIELVAEQGSPLGRWTARHASSDPESNWLSAFGETLARNVTASFAGLSPADFESAAHAIADPKYRVLVIGGRFTQQLGRLLVRHLQIVRGGVEEIGSLSSTWPDRLIDAGRKTIVVAYDIRRYSQDVIRFASLAAEQGARIVAMTDAEDAPILAHASEKMIGIVETAGTWDSLAALLAVTEALAARVTELSGRTTPERLARLESLRDRLFQP
jgi:DNA-binding MurR/RpiR family transcriptional regulator